MPRIYVPVFNSEGDVLPSAGGGGGPAAFRSASVNVTIVGATIGTAPTGYQTGDLLLATASMDSLSGTITPPSGWTLESATSISGAAGDDQEIELYSRIATGSDSFGFSWGSGTSALVRISAWSGVDTVDPFSAAIVTTTGTTPIFDGQNAVFTGVTASEGDCIALLLESAAGAETAVWDYALAASYTRPTNGSEPSAGWWGASELQYREGVSAGATGNFTLVVDRVSGSSSLTEAGFVVAIKSAP